MYKPKPIIPKVAQEHDDRIPYPLFQLRSCSVTCCSPRFSGKSSLLLGLLDDVYARVVKKVIILSDTVEHDDAVAELASRTHDNIYICNEVSNEKLAGIVNEQRGTWAKSNKKDRLFVLIDDAGDQARSKDLERELSKLYTKARHVGIAFAVCIQSVTSQLTNKMKACTSHWMIFKNPMASFKILANALQNVYMNEKETLTYLVECTKEKYSFCYIDTTASSREEMYFYCDKDGFHKYT